MNPFLFEHPLIVEKLLDSLREAVLITNSDNQIIYINERYCELSGYKAEEVLGRNPSVLSSGRQDKAFYQKMWSSIAEQGFWQGEVWNRRKSGELYVQWTNITTIKDEDDSTAYHVGVFTDITSRKNEEDKMQHYAFYDPLTELPNRRLFMERLKQAIKISKRDNHIMAVLFIDLDHFKEINDQYGHDCGDQFLCYVAKLISNRLRESDTLARLGGDEFVVLLPNMASKQAAQTFANELIALFDKNPAEIAGVNLAVQASIGGAMYPEDGVDPEQLVKQADQAMYHVKSSGRHAAYFA